MRKQVIARSFSAVLRMFLAISVLVNLNACSHAGRNNPSQIPQFESVAIVNKGVTDELKVRFGVADQDSSIGAGAATGAVLAGAGTAVICGPFIFLCAISTVTFAAAGAIGGGLAGAAPPLLGWTAVTGEIHGHALLLVLIIFAWTPPHFWALAIHRREEYAAVDIPMLPVTHGVAFTKLHILLYTIIMFLITLLPYATRMSGPLYLLGAVVLGGGFLYWAVELMRGKNPNAPMETFRYSITYLMALFVVMLVDHYLFPVAGL